MNQATPQGYSVNQSGAVTPPTVSTAAQKGLQPAGQTLATPIVSPYMQPSTLGGGSQPQNQYAVVTSKPATDQVSGIQTDYTNRIAPAVASTTATNAATNAANNALPVIPGYNVSPTKTGNAGEVQATNANGQSYFITPQQPALSASDVQGIIGGTDTGTGTQPVQPNQPTPTDIATAQTGTNPATENTQYQNAIQTETDAITSTASQFQGVINSLSAGGIPFTPAQQSLIDATNSAFQQMTTQANLKAAALSSETGGVSDKVNAQGGQLIQIATDQAAAVAKLEVGFQTENFDEKYKTVTEAYAAFKDAETAKMTALTDIHASVMDTYSKALDAAQKQQTATIAKQESDRTFAEQQKKDAADIQHMQNADYISSEGTWTVHDNPDGSQTMVNDRTGATRPLAPNNIVSGTGTPGNTGVPIVDNNTKTTSSGIPYVDGTSLTGKQAIAAQNAAASLHIPYIDKTNSTILDNIETSRANVQNVENDLQGLNPSSGFTRPFVSAAHFLEEKTQIGPGSTQLNSFAADQSALIQTIKGMMSLKIVNRGELNTIINGGGMPTPNDTADVVQAKIAKINNALDTAEKGIMGNKVYDKFNSDSATNDLHSFYTASSAHASQVDSLRVQNPTLTPYQILQIVQP